MSLGNYSVSDSLIKKYNQEGADMPSGIQSGEFPITEFAPTGFGYNANPGGSPDILSNDTQITHFGINAGRVLPYVVAPQPFQDIWTVTVPANTVTYVSLQTDLVSGFSFQAGNVELVEENGVNFIKLDCPRSLNYVTSAAAVEMRMSGTDFYGRKQVQTITTASTKSYGFSTISSIRLDNSSNASATITIGTNSGIGLPYWDEFGYNFLGATYNNAPLLTCQYAQQVYDSVTYTVDATGNFLPIIEVPLAANFIAGGILSTKQAVYGFGSLPNLGYLDSEEFNTDLYSNMSFIIGATPDDTNWIGWRG